eukprot:jgi/Mesvir1/10061/Mv05542-RA.1
MGKIRLSRGDQMVSVDFVPRIPLSMDVDENRPVKKRSRKANRVAQAETAVREPLADITDRLVTAVVAEDEDKKRGYESFSIPNTLAESFIEFLIKPDKTVHVGALCSAMNSNPKDVFGSDSAWISTEEVARVLATNKKLKPLRDSFAEMVLSMQEINSEDEKENLVPYRCVDFLKAMYGHNRFDALHLINFGGVVFNEYKRVHGTSPPTRGDGYKMYFRKDIPLMKAAFDAWEKKLDTQDVRGHAETD